MNYCTHDDCRVDTLEELAEMLAAFPWRGDIMQAMREVPAAQVRCRHVADKRQPRAPLP